MRICSTPTSLLMLVLASGACVGGGAPSSLHAEGVVIDHVSERLGLTEMTSANGTYGASCRDRAGEWSIGLSPDAMLTHQELSVLTNNADCILTLTEVVAGDTHVLAPSLTLSSSYQTSASLIPSGDFVVNAKLSATDFVGPFTMTILSSDDPRFVSAHLDTFTTPVITLASPDEGETVTSMPVLSGIFTDATSGETGQLMFRVDTTPECDETPVQAGSSASSLTSGAMGSWKVGTPLAVGTYYWCAQAHDASGHSSSWSTSRAFAITPVAPVVVATTFAKINNSILTIAKPTGTAQGMTMVAGIMTENNKSASLSGWTSLGHSSNTIGMDILYRVAGASEPASYTFAMTGSAKSVGGIITVSGASATPIDVSGSAAGSWTAPSVTTTTSQTLLIGCWGNITSLGSTPPGTMTERFDGAFDDKIAGACSTEARPQAGATGARVAVGSGTFPLSRLVALKP